MSFLSYIDLTPVIVTAILFAVFGSIVFFAMEKKNRKYLVLAYFGLLIYLTIGKARDAYEVSVNSTKTPADIIIESSDISHTELKNNGRKWSISITFRETAGECGSHGKGEGYLYDSTGGAWGLYNEPDHKLAWGPIDVEAGGSYTYNTGFQSYDGAMKNSDVEITFNFTDDGGRTQSIPWTGHLE